VAALATQPGYPPDFAARYGANVVSKEEDVKSVLAKVALGEADAGIVYATDAASSAAVRSVPIPAAADVVATYGAVVPTQASNAPAAHAFLDWLLGPEGRAVLAGAGFLPPS
jgi:molybdate transport system substrate-binding protein